MFFRKQLSIYVSVCIFIHDFYIFLILLPQTNILYHISSYFSSRFGNKQEVRNKHSFRTSSLTFNRYLIKLLYVHSKMSKQLLSMLFVSNNSLNCLIVEYLYRIAFILFSKLLSEYDFSSISTVFL